MVVLKESSRDWGIVAAVALLSAIANLPTEWTERIIDRRFLLAGLLGVVAIALLRYLKFTLILLIALLALGANLPQEMAEALGVNPLIMLFFLVAVIVIGLSKKLLKLPTGLEGDEARPPRAHHGVAALFNATLKGNPSLVQYLLSHGVDVNARTVSGKTPLMAAVHKGHRNIVQLLIDKGADVNARDTRGDTAVALAKREGHSEIVELLRDADAQEETVTTQVVTQTVETNRVTDAA